MQDERLNLPSASKISCYKACPGAFRLAQGCADIRTADEIAWAESGERIHAFMAGQLTVQDLTESESDVAEKCTEVENWCLTKAFGDFDPASMAMIREKRLWLKVGRKKLMSGKSDLIAIYCLSGFVADYKTSYGQQDPASANWQIRTNIVLAADAHPEIEIWYGAIIQPLETFEPEIVRYTREDVKSAKDELIKLMDEISVEGAPTSAGTHCRYCPAILKCQSALALLQTFGLIDGPSAEGEVLAKYLKLAKAAQPIIDKLEDRAKAMLSTNPAAIPGWCLGKPTSTRTVTDAEKAFELLINAGKIDRDTFMKECIGVGVGDLERGVELYTKLSRKESKQIVSEVVAPVILKGLKKPPLEEV